MKAFIARSEKLDTWVKTEYFCSHCGTQSLWVHEEEPGNCEFEWCICLGCGWMLAVPVGAEITERETEFLALLWELREAIKFPR